MSIGKTVAVIVTVLFLMLSSNAPTNAQFFPPGSYQRTCRDMRMDGSMLYATCRTISGEWTQTSIDTSSCLSQITNQNGILSCMQRLPQVCIQIISVSEPREYEFDNNSAPDFYAYLGIGTLSRTRTSIASNSRAVFPGDWNTCGPWPTMGREAVWIEIYDHDGSSSRDDLADLDPTSSFHRGLFIDLNREDITNCMRQSPNGICTRTGGANGTDRPVASVNYILTIYP
jgi:hypothetical protein